MPTSTRKNILKRGISPIGGLPGIACETSQTTGGKQEEDASEGRSSTLQGRERTPLDDLRQIGRRVEFQRLVRAIEELYGGEDERGGADVLEVVDHELACSIDVMLGIARSVADFAGVVRTRVASRYRSLK